MELSSELALFARALERAFDPATIERGLKDVNAGTVITSNPSPTGIVVKLRGDAYVAHYFVQAQMKPERFVYSTCTCPMLGKCKHVVAAIAYAHTHGHKASLRALSEDLSHVVAPASNSKTPQEIAEAFLRFKRETPPNAIAIEADSEAAVTTRIPAALEDGQPRSWGAAAVDDGLSYTAQSWIDSLEKRTKIFSLAAAHASAGAATAPKLTRLFYVIHLAASGNFAFRSWLEINIAQRRSSGEWGKVKQWANWRGLLDTSAIELEHPQDERIVEMLLARGLNEDFAAADVRNVEARLYSRLIKTLTETGRLFTPQALGRTSLRLKNTELVQPTWVPLKGDQTRLGLNLEEGSVAFLIKDAVWAINNDSNTIFELNVAVPLQEIGALFSGPAILQNELNYLKGRWDSYNLPLVPDPRVSAVQMVEAVPMVPVLTLQTLSQAANAWARTGSRSITVETATLMFDYAGTQVKPIPPAPSVMRLNTQTQSHEMLPRDGKAEAAALETMTINNFIPLIRHPQFGQASANSIADPASPHVYAAANGAALAHFIEEEMPLLEAAGWRINIDPSFKPNYVSIDDFEASLEDTAGGWFSLTLGVRIGDKRVDIAPVLVELRQRYPNLFRPTLASDEPERVPKRIYVTMPDGAVVALPVDRMRKIMSTVTDLLSDGAGKQNIKIAATDLGRLAVLDALLEKNLHASKAARERLTLLKSFHGLEAVAPPTDLQATLRSYQQHGLNWLQFLRQYQLGGLLADDMGLGKTVQALAHIALEKQTGRLTAPVLVVAPTSVVFNWRAEAQRLTPGLKILVLHGLLRAKQFSEIAQHDLIITSYALLPRDITALAKMKFYLVVLDEAHYVKNATTQAAKAVRALDVKHRLCLTGTPVENNLSELWALYDFLMPGFLGTSQNFKQYYRNPIEKDGNLDLRALLAKRVTPFLLRRRKEEVEKELPARTDMTRMVELSAAQTDLYESIRVVMDKKVRDAIYTRGEARSRIVILDALLKLRQVCCDPRLVQLPRAREVKHSAKLDALMELLEELLAEGRRVLVFSQFAQMIALIGERLDEAKIKHAVLTGQSTNREQTVTEFQEGDVPVFLITLKAGGVGLNLTAADAVIHYDPWWNPAAEEQASARAHRIGQTRPVLVVKLVVRGSVEERIIAMQEKKAALARAVTDNDDAEIDALSGDDLVALFSSPGSLPLESAE